MAMADIGPHMLDFDPPNREKSVEFQHGFESVKSDIVMKDVLPACQSTEGVIGRWLMPLKSIEGGLLVIR